jgi:hypothetical protein
MPARSGSVHSVAAIVQPDLPQTTTFDYARRRATASAATPRSTSASDRHRSGARCRTSRDRRTSSRTHEAPEPRRSPPRSPAPGGTRRATPPTHRHRRPTAIRLAVLSTPHLPSRVARIGQDHRHRPRIPTGPTAMPVPPRIRSRRTQHTTLVQLPRDPRDTAPGQPLRTSTAHVALSPGPDPADADADPTRLRLIRVRTSVHQPVPVPRTTAQDRG